MKMQVSVDDVIEVLPESAAPAGKLPKDVSYRPAPELAPVHQEINVIGQRAEEARDAVDEFLDRAVMATASRVRIVHGHGMGILKKTISELLEPAIRTSRSSTRRRSRKAGRARPSWSCGIRFRAIIGENIGQVVCFHEGLRQSLARHCRRRMTSAP